MENASDLSFESLRQLIVMAVGRFSQDRVVLGMGVADDQRFLESRNHGVIAGAGEILGAGQLWCHGCKREPDDDRTKLLHGRNLSWRRHCLVSVAVPVAVPPAVNVTV